MFAGNIRNGVATCGGCITAAEQTAGIKEGEVLHRKICAECNNPEKHNQHATSTPHELLQKGLVCLQGASHLATIKAGAQEVIEAAQMLLEQLEEIWKSRRVRRWKRNRGSICGVCRYKSIDQTSA